MRLLEVTEFGLAPIAQIGLDRESRLEDWLARDLSALGIEAELIGRQVETPFGGRIDLLALDAAGDLVIIEIKRDRSPRESVAQALDYASWVHTLDAAAITELYRAYRHGDLAEDFHRRFGESLPPKLNNSHRLVILAAEIDDATRRLIDYLSETARVMVSAASFSLYQFGDRELLAIDWLIDPVEPADRFIPQVAWAGIWFVNVGPDPNMNWEDNRRYSYVGARGGSVYARRLFNVGVGDWFFAYRKSPSGLRGYVGFGEVEGPPKLAREAVLGGRPFFGLPLDNAAFLRDCDDLDLAAHVLPVRWIKTFPEREARRFKGAFANQNVVCKLTDAATLDFLKREFAG